MRFWLSLVIFAVVSTPNQAHCLTKSYKADYVVVGMGAAGAGVAKILSDDKDVSVIGIEAGGDFDDAIPISDSTYAPVLEDQYFPQFFYQLNQVLQPFAGDAKFNYTTGRMLGGGSSINGEQFVRGSVINYSQWESLLGQKWSTNNIFSVFTDLENYNGISADDLTTRGHKGVVQVRQAPKDPTTMATKFVTAVEEATGFQEILDYNAPQTPLGPFTRWQLFQKSDGRRESSSTAYLKPFVKAKLDGKCKRRLKILDNTTVLKVLFEGNKAIGVRVLKNGVGANVYARKKVILCAGIYSNCLLQVSGIGSKDVLKPLGIDVIYNNPSVGKNLVNQFITSAVFTANPSDPGVPENDPSSLYVGGAFLPDPTEPINPLLRGVQLIGINPAPGSFVIAIITIQPKSRGVVTIQSKDPLKIPLVDDGAFSDPSDLETFMNIYKVYIKEIAARLNAIDNQYVLVDPTLDTINDDALLKDYILKNIDHTHHWTGTCRMAPLDQGGVVDENGNVYGVRNLVIADDSIAPFIPDGNTAACAFMIGRKIALNIQKRRSTETRSRRG